MSSTFLTLVAKGGQNSSQAPSIHPCYAPKNSLPEGGPDHSSSNFQSTKGQLLEEGIQFGCRQGGRDIDRLTNNQNTASLIFVQLY